jgi:AcrR family transcriptional regulator
MPRALGQIDTRKSEAIVSAAFSVMSERGLSAPLEEVARRANVSKQTVYNHYGSKTQLIRTLIERRRDEITAPLARPGALDDPLGALTAYASAMIRSTLTEPYGELMRMAVTGVEDSPELVDILYDTGFMGVRQKLARYLESLTARGVIRADDPVQAAEMFAGLAVGGLQIRRMIGRDLGRDMANEPARAEACARLFLKAFAP